MDFDVLFTILFWTAGLCFVFWASLAITASIAENAEHHGKRDISENLATELYQSASNAAFRAQRGQLR